MTGWHVLIPLKPAAIGKSRMPEEHRAAWVRALAVDTILAARAATRVAAVWVITADAELADILPADVRVVAEDAPGGIDRALAVAASQVGAEHPRASLPGDLGALRAAELDAALAAAEKVARGVVADADGTGTTLVTASAGIAWRTAYGQGSFAAHVALGCEKLEVPAGSGLRADIDTWSDAARVGERLGPRSRALFPVVAS